MKVYFESLKRLYEAGKLDADSVYRAIARGWITEAEYGVIVGLTLPENDSTILNQEE